MFTEAGLLATDIFIYNGDIHPSLYRVFRKHIGASGRQKSPLLLPIPGGDADAAYRIARHFQEAYDNFAVGVWGHCKSAGTLLAIVASELVIESCGELGPLDVQIFRPDEFIRRSSGLSVTRALEFITKKAFGLWEESFLQVRQRNAGIITTNTASEIASQLAIGLFSPITEKIDPTWVGELQRSIDVALHYGLRLGMDPEPLAELIQGFPSHSSVVDFRDAKKLFGAVRWPNDGERFLANQVLQSSSKEFGGDFLREHLREDVLMRLTINVHKILLNRKNKMKIAIKTREDVHLESEVVRHVPQKLTVRRKKKRLTLQSDVVDQPNGPNNCVNRSGGSRGN